MRLLVLSDSHGDYISLQRAVDLHPEADHIVFLGDGVSDFAALRTRDQILTAVSGNWDYIGTHPREQVFHCAGKKILCTHGHLYGVRGTLTHLDQSAQEQEVHIALYGHTHVPATTYRHEIYFFNPGSIKEGSYGLVDILPEGILTSHGSLLR